MSAHSNGGPAFPAQPIFQFPDGCETVCEQSGMTLRAYIATAAMHGLIAQRLNGDYTESGIARAAVLQADALLAELAK